jgi:hypothetical protein
MKTEAGLAFIVAVLCGTSFAATYLVGPGKTYAKLQDVVDRLNPGDTVNVDGNATYPANVYIEQSGTVAKPIIISGVQSSGSTRPKITGTGSYGINITADYVVLQGFEEIGDLRQIGWVQAYEHQFYPAYNPGRICHRFPHADRKHGGPNR